MSGAQLAGRAAWMIAECNPGPASCVGVMVISVNPAACSRSAYSCWVRAPLRQPICRSASARWAGSSTFVGDDVADAQPPAGPQYPECLGDDTRLVGGEVDDAVGDDHVHVPVGQRDVLDVAVQERGVGDAGRGGVGAGEGEHVRAGVQAVGGAAGGDPAGGQQHVQAAAGAQVQDGLAGMQVGDRQRVAAAEAGAQRPLRGTVGSGVGGGAEAPVGEVARVAVGDGVPGEGGAGQAGVPGDDGIPVAGVSCCWPLGRSLGLGREPGRGTAHDDVRGGGEAVHAGVVDPVVGGGSPVLGRHEPHLGQHLEMC